MAATQQFSRLRDAPRAALTVLWLASAAAFAAEEAVPDGAVGPPAPVASPAPETPAEYQCDHPGSDGQALVDKVQRGVYIGVCGTARWFDGLFGTRRYDQDSDATFGRAGLGAYWDDRDGLRYRERMRVRIALPTAQKRMRLLFGHVNEKEIVADAQDQSGASAPTSSGHTEDDAWLVGLGYSRQGELSNGFDFGAGVRIHTPVDPYTKGTYRHNFVLGDDAALRARQTLFWRDSRGLGETTELTVDKLLSEHLLLRWDNSATLADDVDRLEWYSSLTTFQGLGNRAGLAYSGFISGVANTDVPVRNYGAEVRYRRRVLRKWLFLEVRTNVTWPKNYTYEKREIDPGAGIGFEMYFGPVPDTEMR